MPVFYRIAGEKRGEQAKNPPLGNIGVGLERGRLTVGLPPVGREIIDCLVHNGAAGRERAPVRAAHGGSSAQRLVVALHVFPPPTSCRLRQSTIAGKRAKAMRNLIQGIHQFQKEDFRELHDLFQELVHGQNPETLFITCSDSRIDPNRLTHSLPGDLFILRNAGNIVPPHGATATGEAATIEFAVTGLGVKDIIVCGHSHCGAMKALIKPEIIAEMPAMQGWLSHSEATRRIIRENYRDLSGDELLMAAIEENVLVQIEHLQTLPAVAARLRAGSHPFARLGLPVRDGRRLRLRPASATIRPTAPPGTCANGTCRNPRPADLAKSPPIHREAVKIVQPRTLS